MDLRIIQPSRKNSRAKGLAAQRRLAAARAAKMARLTTYTNSIGRRMNVRVIKDGLPPGILCRVQFRPGEDLL